MNGMEWNGFIYKWCKTKQVKKIIERPRNEAEKMF